MHAQPPLAAATDEPPRQRAPVQLELELLDDGGRGRRRGRRRRWRRWRWRQWRRRRWRSTGEIGTGRTAGEYTTLGTTSASVAGSTPAWCVGGEARRERAVPRRPKLWTTGARGPDSPCCGSVRAESSAPGLTSAHGTTEARSERRNATVAHALHQLLALALGRRFGRRMQVDQVPGRGFGLRTSPRIDEDDISYRWARSDPRDPSAGSGCTGRAPWSAMR